MPKSFTLLALLLTLIFQGCVEQVDPEFDFQSDIIFIDAYALTEPGTSSVSISKSVYEDQSNYYVSNELNAKVRLENISTGEIVVFLEDISGIYGSPPGFAVSEGEVWKLHVELENGDKIESHPQTVTSSVPILNAKVQYAEEVEFNVQLGRFIPGHKLSVDLEDPVGEENFYLWKYRTFEPLIVCKTCEKGVLRNGECEPTGLNFGPPYYSYLCHPKCWQINLGKELPVFDDRLEDGITITNREIAILPFHRRQNILIELQQFSLNKPSYEYFKVINTQINESQGLNAPPPAALLGNLYNPLDASDLILGNFTVAGISTKRIFVDRSQIEESPISPPDRIIIETCVSCPTSFPCQESFSRTAIKPEGWP